MIGTYRIILASQKILSNPHTGSIGNNTATFFIFLAQNSEKLKNPQGPVIGLIIGDFFPEFLPIDDLKFMDGFFGQLHTFEFRVGIKRKEIKAGRVAEPDKNTASFVIRHN